MYNDLPEVSSIARPSHGQLSEYNTVYDFITYTPNAGYVGTDFFTYRMMIGSVLTSPATIAVNVLEPDNITPDKIGQFLDNGTRIDGKATDAETGSGNGGGKGDKKTRKNNTEIEMVSADEMTKNSHGKAGTSFMQVLMNKTNGAKSGTGASENGDDGNDDESVDA